MRFLRNVLNREIEKISVLEHTPIREMRAQRSEVTLELTYLAQFGSHLAVQPDFQFVMNPNTDRRIKNAVAFILRFELSL